MRVPCKDCPDRKLGCHSICEKYIKYAEENKKAREMEAQQKSVQNDFLTIRTKRIKKKSML